MKIEQLPSGSYRIRKTYNKKTYTIILGHKPTQKEALQLMAAELGKVKVVENSITFADSAQKYVDSKKNVLSPSTLRDYSRMCHRLPNWFCDLPINTINQSHINKVVNEISLGRKPKTVSNMHGFISAVMGVYRPDLKLYTKLPQKEKKEPYIPTDDDVRRILAHIKGSKYEIAIILGCYGLRRSEICIITADDIEGDTLKIRTSLVQGMDNVWVEKKSNKTTASTREIVIPLEIANAIKEKGYAYQGHPDRISRYLAKVEEELGIEHFSLHKLRHYFASKLSSMQVPDADILALGGWETDRVMKTVYRHSMLAKEKEAQREVSNKLQSALFD